MEIVIGKHHGLVKEFNRFVPPGKTNDLHFADDIVVARPQGGIKIQSENLRHRTVGMRARIDIANHGLYTKGVGWVGDPRTVEPVPGGELLNTRVQNADVEIVKDSGPNHRRFTDGRLWNVHQLRRHGGVLVQFHVHGAQKLVVAGVGFICAWTSRDPGFQKLVCTKGGVP